VAGAADRTTEDRFFATQTPLRRTSLDRSIQGEQNSMTRSSQGRDVTGCCASLTNVKQASATCKRETSLRGLDQTEQSGLRAPMLASHTFHVEFPQVSFTSAGQVRMNPRHPPLSLIAANGLAGDGLRNLRISSNQDSIRELTLMTQQCGVLFCTTQEASSQSGKGRQESRQEAESLLGGKFEPRLGNKTRLARSECGACLTATVHDAARTN